MSVIKEAMNSSRVKVKFSRVIKFICVLVDLLYMIVLSFFVYSKYQYCTIVAGIAHTVSVVNQISGCFSANQTKVSRLLFFFKFIISVSISAFIIIICLMFDGHLSNSLSGLSIVVWILFPFLVIASLASIVMFIIKFIHQVCYKYKDPPHLLVLLWLVLNCFGGTCIFYVIFLNMTQSDVESISTKQRNLFTIAMGYLIFLLVFHIGILKYLREFILYILNPASPEGDSNQIVPATSRGLLESSGATPRVIRDDQNHAANSPDPNAPVMDYGFTEDINNRIEVNYDPNSSKYPIPRYLKRINDGLFSKATAKEIFMVKIETLSKQQKSMKSRSKKSKFAVTLKNSIDVAKSRQDAMMARRGVMTKMGKKIMGGSGGLQEIEQRKFNNELDRAAGGLPAQKVTRKQITPKKAEEKESQTTGKKQTMKSIEEEKEEHIESSIISSRPQSESGSKHPSKKPLKENYKNVIRSENASEDFVDDGKSIEAGAEAEEAKILKGLTGQCHVCYARPADCVVMPCGHAGVCNFCSINIFDKNGKCPICRQVRF